MTSQNVTVLELTDLESAIVTCERENCGTRVIVPLGTRNAAPAACPSCGRALDGNLRARLADLLEFYLKVAATPVRIGIQLRTNAG